MATDKKTLAEKIKANLDKIKLMFAAEPVQTTTADGVSFFTDGDLAVGAKPYTKDDAGNVQPLPVGQYTLQDGQVMDVQADPSDTTGAATIVAALETAAADSNEMTEEELKKMAETIMGSIVKEQMAAIAKINTDAFAEIQKAHNALNAEFKALKEKYEAEVTTNLAFKKEVVELIKKIADEPAAEPAKKPEQFSKFAKSGERLTTDSLVENYLSQIKN